MTANDTDPIGTSILVHDVPGMDAEAVAWVRARLTEKTEGVCETLKTIGAKCEARVVDMEPIAAIRYMMSETKADLLILGAQGHGFIERLTIGSISLYEVIAEPYNVLLIRAAKRK
jgi:nucleotide-binding universal stress UspA family protein